MTCLPNVHYKCMKFLWNTSKGYQVIERTRNSIANDQREISPKISKAELWFLCMTHYFIVLKKCMKFQPNSLTVFYIQSGQTIAFSYVTREIIWKENATVMVLVQDTSFECALQMYEVCLKYLWRLSSYRADRILWWTDRQTDGRRDKRKGKAICLPTLSRGDIMKS